MSGCRGIAFAGACLGLLLASFSVFKREIAKSERAIKAAGIGPK
jgi:hypothetical protein